MLPPDPSAPSKRPSSQGGVFRSASERDLAALAAAQFPRRSITTGNRDTAVVSRGSVFGPVEVMIDTVHVVFPVVVSQPLVNGWRVREDAKRRFDWEVAEDFKFEGTWGTNILVVNVGEDGRRVSNEHLQKLGDADNRRLYRQWVKVMGSPTKHATGQNCFGTPDMESILLYFLDLIRTHPHVDDVDELEFWRSARLTKVDFSGIVSVPYDDKLWLLDYISKHAVVAGKHKDINGTLRGNTTWYSHYAAGGTQAEHQLKLYCKLHDIQKHERKGGVRRDLYFYPQLLEDARNWLRVERALHTKALRRWYADTPSWWTTDRVRQAWEDGMGGVAWPDFTRGDVHKVVGDGVLSPGAYASFYGWLAGDDPYGCAKRGTLYRSGSAISIRTLQRHRKEIQVASRNRIDIKNPRAVDQRAEVVRIVRVGAVSRPAYLGGLPLVA